MTEEDFHKQKTLHDLPADQTGPVPLIIPEKIGPYKIESLLETGGMSQVYLATHPDTKEPVTIKVLLPKFHSNPEVVQRFVNEAEIIALADHPNIVKLYSQGQWENGLYIAMEFIQGTSLRQFLQHNPLSLKRALEIILEISYALCHLHTHGVIHRDLKLENILMTESGHIKVIDFGIAQILSENPTTSHTSRPRIIGTPIYMSPEQRENPESVSYPSDIYSLGIIAYELVLGKLSHGHIHLSLMPKGFQKILAKALQPNPDDRYQDVVDFIAEVSGYLNSTMVVKDRKNGDQLGEIVEQLHRVQNHLIPTTPPLLSHVEIGVVTYKGTQFAGLYYDFFELENKKIFILLAETPSKTAEGLTYIAQFRAMVRTVFKNTQDSVELASQLNALISQDSLNQAYHFNLLILDPLTSSAEYLCCGTGNLWNIVTGSTHPEKILNKNALIGQDKTQVFHSTTFSWQIGDYLILNNFLSQSQEDPEKDFNHEFFKQIIQDSLFLSPQKQAEILLRKTKALSIKQIDQAFAIISIHRVE